MAFSALILKSKKTDLSPSACQAEVWFWNYLLSRQCSKNIIFHSKKYNTYTLYSVCTSSSQAQPQTRTCCSLEAGEELLDPGLFRKPGITQAACVHS